MVFLVGGSLQFLKVIKYTQLNILFSLLFFIYTLLIISWKKKIDITPLIILFIFLFWGLLSAYINSSDSLNLKYFLVQVFLYGSVYYFIRIAKPNVLVTGIDFLYFISLIQLPVILLQRTIFPFFSNYIIHTLEVSYRDIGFGTFSLAEDHILGFLIITMILMILTGTYKVKRKGLSIAYLSISILATNSKVTIIILLLFGGYYLFQKSKALLITLLLLGLIAFTLLKTSAAVQQIAYKFEFIKEYLQKDSSVESVTYRIEKHLSSRKDVVIYFINHPVNWLGYGPGAYHNYKTLQFFNGHFGQSLWFYRDYGLIGLLLSFIMLILIERRYPSRVSKVILMIVFIYSIFANLFFSLAFLLLYNLFLKYNWNNEHSRNTIPRLA